MFSTNFFINLLHSFSDVFKLLKQLVNGLEECFTATRHHYVIVAGSTWEPMARGLKLGVSNFQETSVPS